MNAIFFRTLCPLPTLLLLGLSLGLLLVIGCGQPGPEERVILADFDFSQAHVDSLYGPVFSASPGLHQFSEGWRPPLKQGLASWGKRSEFDAHVMGREIQLEMICETTDVLARRNLQLTLRVNDRMIDTYPLHHSPSIDTLKISIPDELIHQGSNRLSFIPSVPANPQEQPRRKVRLRFLVKSLRLSALLSQKERKDFERLHIPSSSNPTGEDAMIPERDLREARGKNVDRPDVLMLVLDALRADHLSSYGYSRETSPSVDRLASEGVALENVYSEASFTRCSVPTYMTGRSWQQHQVLHKYDVLSDEFLCLAEILQAAGYHTAAITDNPNASSSSGIDQGFSEFIETWSQTEQEDYPVEFAEELFHDRLQEGFGPEPVFFYVHLLPPHAPYLPGEEHDLWNKGRYSNLKVVDTPLLQKYDSGQYKASGPRHQRIIDLYDGGIHRGDAMIGRILQAWQSLDRDRPLRVVFLSDHGEGFGEHGRFRHATTVHEEMTHVPLIFWPAEQFPELQKSAKALRGLGDLPAILLHHLRIDPPRDSTWPVPFIEAFSDPSRERSQIFTFGWDHTRARPIYGLRTKDSLCIFESMIEQSYFDLRKDPSAKNNLRAEQTGDYAHQLITIRSFVESAILLEQKEGEAPSQEVQERLKALGYF